MSTQTKEPDRIDAGRAARCISPSQLARLRGVSIHCILALIRAGEIKATNYASPGSTRKRWKISPAALADFEERHSSKPAPTPARKRKPPKDPNFVEYY